jgi:hypothetical protein
LEQYYLDNFELKYNIRRTSTGPAPIKKGQSVNAGSANPQFGLEGKRAAHWGHKHSPEQIRLWGRTRSTTYYLYSLLTGELTITCLGQAAVALFLSIGESSTSTANNYGIYRDYYISTVLLSRLEVQAAYLTAKANLNWKGPVFIYNKGRTVLPHTCLTVQEFSDLSGLTPSAIRNICLSPTHI